MYIFRSFLVADEIPTGDKAVFAFLEMIALAFAFEGVSSLLAGSPWPVCAGSLLGAVMFFVAGIKWSWIKNTAISVWHSSKVAAKWMVIGSLLSASLVGIAVRVWVTHSQSTQRARPDNDIKQTAGNYGNLAEQCGSLADKIQDYMADHVGQQHVNSEYFRSYVLSDVRELRDELRQLHIRDRDLDILLDIEESKQKINSAGGWDGTPLSPKGPKKMLDITQGDMDGIARRLHILAAQFK